MSEATKLSDFEKRIISNIEQHGCQVNHVFDPDGNDPGFSYSIGFPTSVGQPEAIVFGLRSEVMHFMINELLDQCEAGLIMSDGGRVSGLLEGVDCELREVIPAKIKVENFSSAIWYARACIGEPMKRAFQVVWPGAVDKLYPWDEGADREVVRLQPQLYEGSVH